MEPNVEQVAAQEELVSQETQSPETVDTETQDKPVQVSVEERLRQLEGESQAAKEAARLADEALRKQQSNFNKKEAQILAELETTRAKLRESLPPEDLVPDLQQELNSLKGERTRERMIDDVGREFNISPQWLKDQNPQNPEHLRQIAQLAAQQVSLAIREQEAQKRIDEAVKKAEEAARQATLKVRKELGVDTVAGTGAVAPGKTPLQKYLADEMNATEKEQFEKAAANGELHDKFWKPLANQGW